MKPESLPGEWIAEVERVNELGLKKIAEKLVLLRR